MNGSGPGESGVIAWCNSIRFTLANDPQRKLLDVQFQEHGFDYLDNYLEGVLSRAKESKPMYELLKTPGKKKDAPKRTRAATAAAAKIKALNTAALEEESPSEHSSQEPALPTKKAEGSARPHRAADKGASHVKRKPQRIVTIVDTPEPPKPEKLDLGEEDAPDPDENAPPSPTPAPTTGKLRSPQLAPAEVSAATPAPREQRRSPEQTPPAHVPSQPEHTSECRTSEETMVENVDEVPPIEDADVEPEVQDDMSIVEEAVEEDVQMHTASSKELSMIMEGDENGENSRLSALPIAEPPIQLKPLEDHDAVPVRDVPINPLDQDMTVPLRDGPSNPSLKRKPSVTGLSGLPAPSPLRKSMRMSREPSMGTGLLGVPQAHTPGSGLTGGKRTSWLTKAKEVKALELTAPGKRVAGLGAGRLGFVPRAGTPTNAQEGDKPKSSGDLFGLGITTFESTDADSNQSPLEEKAPESGALAFIKKRKAASSEDITGKFNFPQATRGQSSLPTSDTMVPISNGESEQSGLHKLRQTVEDARMGKSLGKSLGGHAAAELAAARARAEAKVAQRNKEEGSGGGDDDDAMDIDDDGVPVTNHQAKPPPAMPSKSVDETRRLSVSDLVSVSESKAQATKEPSPKAATRLEDTSTSTTPPNSPPSAISKPATSEPLPVFSKPPPVFVPPPRSPARPPPPTAATRASPPSTFANDIFKLPTTNPFSLPATTLGVGAALQSPKSKKAPTLSQQSSKASLFSDGIFDEKDTIPPWVPPTQDTDYSLHNPQGSQPLDDLDDDDSWHMDDKFKTNQAWTPFGFGSAERDDTMTWSTLPSRSTSQKGGDTGPVYATATQNFAGEDIQKAASAALAQHLPPALEPRQHEPTPDVETPDEATNGAQPDADEQDSGQDDMDIDDDYPGVDTELEDIVAAGKSTISLVKQPSAPRAPSQQSMASTSSSQSQLGFFGQARRLATSVLGGGKTKTKPEPVKSIALAAAAAKKQQEEADKKAARMKEMETRRLQAQQRKVDEEKARAQEEEKRLREEAERRKREREEQTDKRPLKSTMKKPEEDTTKKRKLNPEVEKKAESTKPPSKDNQASRSIKPPSASVNAPSTAPRPGTFKSALSKQPSSSSMAASAAGPSTHKAPASETKAGKLPTSTSNTKVGAMKTKAKALDKEDAQPSQLIQGQMAHRAKAQMQSQTPKQPAPVASESIELPDINSEYSDSDDEDRPRTFNPPEWAQSPELRQQLEQQSLMNPDDVFGPIGPLRMEEIFRTRQSRFRARTSSANWAGTDQLTAEEEREYARRMGFK